MSSRLWWIVFIVGVALLAACTTPTSTPTPTPPPGTPTPTPPVLAATLTPLAAREREVREIDCGVGETLTVFSAGEKDDFDPDPDTPPASPSAALGLGMPFTFPADFDSPGIFGHTFADLPANITRAQLEIGVKPGASSADDQLQLLFRTQAPPTQMWWWHEYMGTYPPVNINGLLPNSWGLPNYPNGHVFVFDLGNMPTPGSPYKLPSVSSDLVQYMNQYHVLDVVAWSGGIYYTPGMVDYLTLTVCSTPGEAPPAPDLAISKSSLISDGGYGTSNIVIENQGNATASSPILVVDTLPVGFTFLSATNPSWNCIVTQPVTDPATDQQTVECTQTTTIPPGVTLTLTMEIRADPLFTQAPNLNCAEVQHPDDVFLPNNEICAGATFFLSAEALAAPLPTYPSCPPTDPLTTISVGEQDGFDPDPDTPPASPDPGLTYMASPFGVEGFDTFDTAAYFAHTFNNLPADIGGAWLQIRLKPGTNPFPNPEYILLATIGQIRGYNWLSQLDFQGLVPSPWVPNNYPQGHTIFLDLSVLPPSAVPSIDQNLIPGMRYSRTLDILIPGDSAVDYITLRVCNTPSPTPTATPTPTPTPTATPTATPTSTPTPEATDLTLDKFANLPFQFGQQASYTFQILNVGTGSARGPITVVDVLPNGITYVSFTDPYSSDWSCSAAGQTVTCIYAGPDIAPGGVLPTLTINVQIASIGDFPAGSDQVENCATVRYNNDVNPSNDQGCVSTVVTSPGAAG